MTKAVASRSLDGLTGRTLLLVVNNDWFFRSHFLALARAARDAGMRVSVCTQVTDSNRFFADESFELVPLSFARDGTNPLRELATVAALHRIYRRRQPALIHHITPKLVIYGSLAARTLSTSVINTVSGLGTAFVHPSGGLVAGVMQRLFRLALHRTRTWTQFENPDDRDLFVQVGLVPASSTVIVRGVGVDTEVFYPGPPEPGDPVVLLPARILADKGVLEFCEAARILADRGSTVRMVLVGRSDPDNRSGLAPDQLERLTSSSGVQWWGHRDDMPSVLRRAHIAALPSYREGLPKALLEAAATGLPLVATDVPGCREVCLEDVTGLLIPPRDPLALALAIEELANDPQRRHRLGVAARALVQEHFSIGQSVEATLALYAHALART